MCTDDRTGARRRKREDPGMCTDGLGVYIDDFRRVSGVDLLDDDEDDDNNENGDASPCKKRGTTSNEAAAEVVATTWTIPSPDREDARFRRFLARPVPEVRVADLWRELAESAPYRCGADDRRSGCCDRFALAALRHSTEWRALVDANTFGDFFERALARHFREWVDDGATAAAVVTDAATPSRAARRDELERSERRTAETAAVDDASRCARETERCRAGEVAEWLEAMPDHVALCFPLAVGRLCERDATPELGGGASREAATSAARVKFGLAHRGVLPRVGYANLARFAAWTVGRFARSLGVRLLPPDTLQHTLTTATPTSSPCDAVRPTLVRGPMCSSARSLHF